MATVSSRPDLPGFRCVIAAAGADRMILRVTGDLDMAAAPVLERELAPLLGGRARVDLDAADVDFIDCAGVRVLLRAWQRDPRFTVVSPSDSVRRLIQLLDLDLPVADRSRETPTRRPD